VQTGFRDENAETFRHFSGTPTGWMRRRFRRPAAWRRRLSV